MVGKEKGTVSMIVGKDKGVVTIPSNHSVDETVDRLKNILRSKEITLFALIDHSGEAAKVGMKMPPTKLLIFGNPKGGTPLMLAAPSIALDLPLKILVSEDAQGKVWLSYNSPAYLKERHALPSNLLQNIAVIEPLPANPGEWFHDWRDPVGAGAEAPEFRGLEKATVWPVSARGVITAISINAALTALCQRRKCAAARHTLMLMGIVLPTTITRSRPELFASPARGRVTRARCAVLGHDLLASAERQEFREAAGLSIS